MKQENNECSVEMSLAYTHHLKLQSHAKHTQPFVKHTTDKYLIAFQVQFIWRHYSKQEDHQLVGQAKRSATKIRSKAVGGGILEAFSQTSMNADRRS